MSNKHRSSIWLVLLAACVPARAPESASGAAPAAPVAAAPGAASASERPTAAASASSAERIGRDVAWLADDAQQGRRAGTEAARAAARYLAARFTELGLEPAGDGGTFFQEFEVPLAPRVGDDSAVGWTAADGAMVTWQKTIPLFCSDAGTVEGSFAFRGFGLESREQNWDDFRGARLDGAVVVLLRGVPPDSELVKQEAKPGETVQHAAVFDGSIFQKVMNAKRHGAAAVILLQEEGARDPLGFDASQAARAGIPALSAPRQLFEKLVGADAANGLYAAASRRDHADFDAPSAALRVRVTSDVRRERGAALNVLARLAGSESRRTVVIGAHYDHLGLGGEGSLAAELQGQVHNGADDNASGTAAVLEMARVAASGPRPAGDLVFALWSGEELGLLGSEFWCSHPTLPLSQVRANLNLDMVGRARPPEDRAAKPLLTVLGAGTSVAFQPWLEPAATRVGLALSVNRSGQGVGGSDHMSFQKREIPVLHFFTGLHEDYHKPSDDTARVDCESIARIADLGLELVARMQAERELPWNRELAAEIAAAAEKEPAQRGGRFSVWFGSIPEYGYEGKGVLLSGTSSGSPAQKAGLLKGDVLVGVGDVAVDTIHDFVYALRLYKPGDVVEARYLRDGAAQSVRITLSTRSAE